MKPITSGQKEQVVTVATSAARKATEEAIQDLEKNDVINGDNIQKLVERGNELKTVVMEAVKKKLAEITENVSGCLKLISGAETITLKPTDGKETIARAEKVFTWGIDCDFKNWGCDVKSEPTKETNVAVHELIKNGNYQKIFDSLSEDSKKLCLPQPQIIQFVKNHHKWLSTDFWTLFLFEANGELFVARVDLDSDGAPKVHVYRFLCGIVWYAEGRSRIVVPQLTLES
ncbi:MAG: hypothetical protein WCO48_00310 [Candidatus Taylorbacteria bacterium]